MCNSFDGYLRPPFSTPNVMYSSLHLMTAVLASGNVIFLGISCLMCQSLNIENPDDRIADYSTFLNIRSLNIIVQLCAYLSIDLTR